jgi:oligopeptide/dipeptide ABC transporter ATP-binding protein
MQKSNRASLLEVKDLVTCFDTDDGELVAVNGVSFRLDSAQTLAIVGESGCGKSVTSLSIMSLLPQSSARIRSGSIRFEGQELVGASPTQLQKLRGHHMAMIFQEPMTSLNPSYTVGEQIIEGLLRHLPIDRVQAKTRAIEMLLRVGIPAPEKRINEYPHQLSGGMRQRVMIAIALACNPKLLIADEPTTALDVTIQAQILELMRELQKESQAAIILITHDLGVVAEMADQVLVMYAGQVVEQASAKDIFDQPQHPYTVGLLGCIPQLDHIQNRLASIDGQVPSPLHRPAGCAFEQRCPFALPSCKVQNPVLTEIIPNHWSACHRAPLIVEQLMPHVQL